MRKLTGRKKGNHNILSNKIKAIFRSWELFLAPFSWLIITIALYAIRRCLSGAAITCSRNFGFKRTPTFWAYRDYLRKVKWKPAICWPQSLHILSRVFFPINLSWLAYTRSARIQSVQLSVHRSRVVAAKLKKKKKKINFLAQYKLWALSVA